MARTTIGAQLTQAQGTIAELRGQIEHQQVQLAQGVSDLRVAEANLDRVSAECRSLSDTNNTLQSRLAAATEQLEKLQKDHDQHKSMRDHYSREHDKATAELEQAHAVLDAVDGAPTRKYEKEYGEGSRNVVTRLAGAFLAISKGAK